MEKRGSPPVRFATSTNYIWLQNVERYSLPLPAVLAAFDIPRSKLLRIRPHLAKPIPAGSKGVTTYIDRETALDLAFMVVLTQAGLDSTQAAHFSKKWREEFRDTEDIPAGPFRVLNPRSGTFLSGEGPLNVSRLVESPQWQESAASAPKRFVRQ